MRASTTPAPALDKPSERNSSLALKKFVSGGQTGVDQAALQAALRLGLEVGGWAPPDGCSEAGPVPAQFGLAPTPYERSPQAPDVPRSLRTEWNVRDSDATMVLFLAARPTDAGTRFALESALRLGRPSLLVSLNQPDALERSVSFVQRHAIYALHVGGPSESTQPGIYNRGFAFLQQLILAVRSTVAGPIS